MPDSTLREIAARQTAAAQSRVQEVAGNWSSQLEQLLRDQISGLLGQIESCVSVQMDEATAAAGYKSRRAAVEDLNQLIRRLRECKSAEEVAVWLIDSTSAYCGRAALFEVIGTRVRGVGSRGFADEGGATFETLEAPLDRAPALAHAIEERDTVVTLGAGSEVSPEIVTALGHSPGERVHLFPILIEERAAAVLYAVAGESGPVDGAALELLSHAAGSAVRLLAPVSPPVARQLASSELISIQGVKTNPIPAGKRALPRQALDTRARWFAQTESARMRLFHRAGLE
ncbi:MAG TPA: hypothetical protein VL285_19470, partial [Bryobacteraceae bacterium]|nr:hypothetical protein [Bryobacteraceae bacterium]